MKIEIKHRFSGAVLFALEAESIKLCLQAAVKSGADLYGADLDGFILVGERPVLQIGPIGSRSDYLFAFLTKQGIRIRAGCFTGTPDEFAARVKETYGDRDHGRDQGINHRADQKGEGLRREKGRCINGTE